MDKNYESQHQIIYGKALIINSTRVNGKIAMNNNSNNMEDKNPNNLNA